MSNSTAIFVLQAVLVSLSGVMAPGAMTASALAAGTRSRHAGALMAVGHGIVEFPLMVLIMLGAGAVFENHGVKSAVGLAGGVMLLWLAVGMFRGARAAGAAAPPAAGRLARKAILTGIVLTAGNPLFLLWWASVGLGLTLQAAQLGVAAFAAFAVIHWVCDLLWLEGLTLATYKGSALLGARGQRAVLIVCAAALVVIAGKFLFDAGAAIKTICDS